MTKRVNSTLVTMVTIYVETHCSNCEIHDEADEKALIIGTVCCL